MSEKRADARSCSYGRPKEHGQSSAQILPNWTAIVMGIALGWPFIWAALMW